MSGWVSNSLDRRPWPSALDGARLNQAHDRRQRIHLVGPISAVRYASRLHLGACDEAAGAIRSGL